MEKDIALLKQAITGIVAFLDKTFGTFVPDCGADISDECSPDSCKYYPVCKIEYEVAKDVEELKKLTAELK